MTSGEAAWFVTGMGTMFAWILAGVWLIIAWARHRRRGTVSILLDEFLSIPRCPGCAHADCPGTASIDLCHSREARR